MDDGLTREELTNLYRRYGFLLRRRCMLILRNAASADDALQETFVKLLRAGSGVRQAEQPLRYLQRVADRTCFDQLRRNRVRLTTSIDEDGVDELPAPPGIDVDARNAALRVLGRLDEEEQKLALLAYVDCLTQAEIARELGVSQPAIHKRLVQLRERATRAAHAVGAAS